MGKLEFENDSKHLTLTIESTNATEVVLVTEGKFSSESPIVNAVRIC